MLPRMRNVSDRMQKKSKHAVYVQKISFFLENRAVCEIRWKNMIEPDTPQMTVKYYAEKVRLASRMTKAKIQTHL
jgi:hypothetical protein